MRSLVKGFDILESGIRIVLDTLSFLDVVNNGIDFNFLYCVIDIAKNCDREFGKSFLILVTLSFDLERLDGFSRGRVSWLGSSIDASLIEITNFLLLRC